MNKNNNPDVIIAGAGLTGLTAAWHLGKMGLEVVVLEKNNRPGGVIQTFREDGFVFEAGPNTGVLSHPEAAELFEELGDLCKLEIANPDAKRRLIWKSGEWQALPAGLISAIKTPLFTPGDKLRIFSEPFRPKGTDPFETLERLVLRRLGRSYLDYAVDPFISGIYAGDPSKLVTRYALPKLYALEQNYGSFIGGALRKKFESVDERMKKATKDVFSAEGGLSSLTDGLAAGIGAGRIVLNAENTIVNPHKEGFRVNYRTGGHSFEITAPYVVSTVDSQILPGLLPFLREQDHSDITQLEYAAVTQVIMGYKNWKGMELNAFGGLVPSKEQRDILGVLFTSSFLNNRAPEDGALLSVFLGGCKRPGLADLEEDKLKALVYKEIQEMLRVKDPEPDIFRIFRYKRAIPQYGRSSEKRLKAISNIENKYSGLVLAGAIRDGIGMADRIRQAKNIAEVIAKDKAAKI